MFLMESKIHSEHKAFGFYETSNSLQDVDQQSTWHAHYVLHEANIIGTVNVMSFNQFGYIKQMENMQLIVNQIG